MESTRKPKKLSNNRKGHRKQRIKELEGIVKKLEELNKTLINDNIDIIQQLNRTPVYVYEEQIREQNNIISKLRLNNAFSERISIQSNIETFNKNSEISGMEKRLNDMIHHNQYLVSCLQSRDSEIYYLRSELAKFQNTYEEEMKRKISIDKNDIELNSNHLDLDFDRQTLSVKATSFYPYKFYDK
jgi:hypothetical protein